MIVIVLVLVANMNQVLYVRCQQEQDCQEKWRRVILCAAYLFDVICGQYNAVAATDCSISIG